MASPARSRTLPLHHERNPAKSLDRNPEVRNAADDEQHPPLVLRRCRLTRHGPPSPNPEHLLRARASARQLPAGGRRHLRRQRRIRRQDHAPLWRERRSTADRRTGRCRRRRWRHYCQIFREPRHERSRLRSRRFQCTPATNSSRKLTSTRPTMHKALEKLD